MSENKTFLLQLWKDAQGPWVVVKDQVSGELYQFESFEALTRFLSAPTEYPVQGQTLVRGSAESAEPDSQRVG